MVPIPTEVEDDGSGSFTAPSPVSGLGLSLNSGLLSDDANKKIRKPYTITKSRESWTEQEHDKFLESLQLFDRDWKKIEAFVGSKTVIQIRSHAQKYFLKVQKNGTSDHVPPPRPKRKAAHPYPQKASKNVFAATQSTQTSIPLQASPCIAAEQGYAIKEAAADSSSVQRKSNAGATAPSWSQNTTPPFSANNISSGKDFKDELRNVGSATNATNNNCCSSSETPSGTWPISETTEQIHNVPANHVMPDFAQVHKFIGSVFDPSVGDHLETLKRMEPIDVETVLQLMKNLSVNLKTPDFEEHRKLLSLYSNGSDETKSNGNKDRLFHSKEVTNGPIR